MKTLLSGLLSGFAGALVGSLMIGAPNLGPERLTARSIEIVDADGQPRFLITGDQGGRLEYYPQSNAYGEDPGLVLGGNGFGGPTLELLAPDRSKRFDLTLVGQTWLPVASVRGSGARQVAAFQLGVGDLPRLFLKPTPDEELAEIEWPSK